MNGFRTAPASLCLALPLLSCLRRIPRDVPIADERIGATGWVLTDLDGDRQRIWRRPTRSARLRMATSHNVNIDLTGFKRPRLWYAAYQPFIRLSFRDIDGDNDRDLIVLEPGPRYACGRVAERWSTAISWKGSR